MADFFNKLKKSIDKGTAIVGAKSTTLIETNKLKQDISTTKRLKKDTLLELGQTVYDMGREGTFTIESVEGLFTKITEADLKVVDLEAKIKVLQDEEKEKLDEINAKGEQEDVEAAVDVEATEVEVEPVVTAPVADEAEATEEVTENETGEYNE